METLFIACEDTPTHERLTTCFNTVVEAMARVEPAVAGLKQRRGERLSREHADQKLRTQRERAYEVAYIRLEREAFSLYRAVHALYAAAADARKELAEGEQKLYLTRRGLLQNNILCAEELGDKAAGLYFASKKQHLDPESIAPYCIGIERAFEAGPDVPEPREWTVMYSGHGSQFRFESEDGKTVPPAPYMTQAEAEYAADHWIGHADTIGGDARVYNVRTGESYRPGYRSTRS